MALEDLAAKASGGKVQVVRAGEETEIPRQGFHAPATVTLIRDVPDYRYCLVDAGGVGEAGSISRKLRALGVAPGSVGLVVATHTHLDHVGAIGDFSQARVYTPDSFFDVSQPNLFLGFAPDNFYSRPGNEWEVAKDIKLLSTPGHSGWDVSVLYTASNGKRILMAGDLFWSQRDFDTDKEFPTLCVNYPMQAASRNWVREQLMPDLIVPGHDLAFAPKYKS